jgi:plasmid stabilization system protein ParE
VKVRFRPEAAAELLHARDWYASRETGLGDEFAAAVDATVNRVVAHPRAFRALPRVPGVRRAQLRRFPFVLLFRVLASETIEVIAVAHMRRRPGYWQRRLR